jgi:phospholipid/cholesterol/gamma-HCH transport system substrate-binding protein
LVAVARTASFASEVDESPRFPSEGYRALDEFVGNLKGQTTDRKLLLDEVIRNIPDAQAVLKGQWPNLIDTFDSLGSSALTAGSLQRTQDSLAKELHELGPVLPSLADSGPALTRPLSFLSVYPWVK